MAKLRKAISKVKVSNRLMKNILTESKVDIKSELNLLRKNKNQTALIMKDDDLFDMISKTHIDTPFDSQSHDENDDRLA